MPRLYLLLALVLAASSGPVLAQDKPTIQALSDQFAQTFNRGDVAAVAALYTADAYLMPPGAALMKGRAVIEAFWKGAGTQVGDLQLTTVDVLALGDTVAEEVGSFTMTTKSQPPQKIAGKYVVLWRKEAAGWLIATDIWNADQ